MVEIEAPEGEKPKYASLKKGQLIEALTLDEALSLFALPRNVGRYKDDDLIVGIGRYGAYVRHGKTFASLDKKDDPYTITFDRAVELLEARRSKAEAASIPLRTFDENPDVVIKNGVYGPYIAGKGKNYRLPKSVDPQTVTLEECLKIMANSKTKK